MILAVVTPCAPTISPSTVRRGELPGQCTARVGLALRLGQRTNRPVLLAHGIQGRSLAKRTIYITDSVFSAMRVHASASLLVGMDLAYQTGQRPAEALSMSDPDIIEGHLIVTQEQCVRCNGWVK